MTVPVLAQLDTVTFGKANLHSSHTLTVSVRFSDCTRRVDAFHTDKVAIPSHGHWVESPILGRALTRASSTVVLLVQV